MIRRELAARDGAPAAWVLISQIDHAHLAGQLAEHWGAGGFAALEPHDELLWAIFHHDDGWLDWDRSPGVNPDTGVPRQFTEMEPAETLAIWTKSIDAAAARGPLEGYLVAGHFCRLGRRGTAGKEHDPQVQPFVRFLDDYEARARTWLALWQVGHEHTRTHAVAEQALDQLQFFDTFSLWFCCSESTEREVVDTPAGIDLTLAPRGPFQIRLSPWPYRVGELDLLAPGRLIPAAHYPSREALAAAPSQPITLRWKLSPESPNS
jgi:hypothetical protein